MNRREFFRRGISNVAEKTVNTVSDKVTARAKNWIRPPFALPELEFLLSCTRCDACIAACPHNIIFPLSAKKGADVMQTPALDLLNSGCHLCQDWPCVTSCQTNALSFDAVSNTTSDKNRYPILAKAVINENCCLPYNGPECGACASACSVDGALQWTFDKPKINLALCVGCALCREHCITDPKAIEIFSINSE